MIQAWIAERSAKLIATGIVVVILCFTHTGAYWYGRSVQKQAQAKAEATVLKGELKKTQQEAKVNAKIGEKVGAESAVLDARLEAAIGELNEAIARANRGTSCDLTDDELRALQALSDSYGQ